MAFNLFGIKEKAKQKKAELEKRDETFLIPQDIDKNDPLWKLRTINDIVIAICGRLTRKSSYGENMGMLSSEERIFYIATEIDSQVNSMGFEYFFFDEAGRFAMEAPEALRSLGAEKRAEYTEKAIELVGGNLVEDNKERANFIRNGLTDEIRKGLKELDEEYKHIEDDFNRLLYRYLAEYHYKFVE